MTGSVALPVSEQDVRVVRTASDRVRLMLSDEADARAYLATSFLSGAILALHDARVAAGLTQEDVARTMDTKQPSIARLENDLSGGVSLRRYVDYAIAVGALPFDIVLGQLEQLRQFAIEHPGREITQVAVRDWESKRHEVLTPRSTSDSQPSWIAYAFQTHLPAEPQTGVAKAVSEPRTTASGAPRETARHTAQSSAA